MQEMPVQSTIVAPLAGSTTELDEVEVKLYHDILYYTILYCTILSMI